MYSEIVIDVIDDFDNNIITLPCMECWPWKFAVDGGNSLGGTQPCVVLHNHLIKKKNKRALT